MRTLTAHPRPPELTARIGAG